MHTNPFSKVALREKRNTSKTCKNPTSYPQADSSSVAKHMQMVYKQNQSDAQVVSPWPYQHMQLQYSKSLRLGLPQWPRAHSSYHNRLVDHLQITNYFLRLEDPKSCRTMPWFGRAECRFHIVHPCVCHVWDLPEQIPSLGSQNFFLKQTHDDELQYRSSGTSQTPFINSPFFTGTKGRPNKSAKDLIASRTELVLL